MWRDLPFFGSPTHHKHSLCAVRGSLRSLLRGTYVIWSHSQAELFGNVAKMCDRKCAAIAFWPTQTSPGQVQAAGHHVHTLSSRKADWVIFVTILVCYIHQKPLFYYDVFDLDVVLGKYNLYENMHVWHLFLCVNINNPTYIAKIFLFYYIW